MDETDDTLPGETGGEDAAALREAQEAAARIFGGEQAPGAAPAQDQSADAADDVDDKADDDSQDAAGETAGDDGEGEGGDGDDELGRLRAEVERLRHQVKSDGGQVAALQRKLAEERRSAEQRVKAAREEMARLREKLPAIAKDFEELSPVARLQELQATQIEELQRRIDAEAASVSAAREKEVDAAFPGWRDFLGEHGPRFLSWVEDQPKALREAYARNAGAITDAAETVNLLKAFQTSVSPGSAPNGAIRNQAADKRQRQRDAASAPPSSTKAARVPHDGTPPADASVDQSWDWAAREASRIFG